MKECILVLENIRSVANVGSIFRTAECLGIKKLILVGTTPAPIDRFGRKRKDFAKVSLGAEEMILWEYHQDLSTIQDLKTQGYKIIALEQNPAAIKLTANSLKLKAFVLIVGNEVEGVSKAALEYS